MYLVIYSMYKVQCGFLYKIKYFFFHVICDSNCIQKLYLTSNDGMSLTFFSSLYLPSTHHRYIMSTCIYLWWVEGRYNIVNFTKPLYWCYIIQIFTFWEYNHDNGGVFLNMSDLHLWKINSCQMAFTTWLADLSHAFNCVSVFAKKRHRFDM